MTRFGIPWSIRARWRAFRHAGGDFAVPEASERATALGTLWDRNWPGAEPLGHLLRSRYEARWVRFHSLPNGKADAETEEERSEVLRRHLTVIKELQVRFGGFPFIIIAADWGPDDFAGGWTKSLIPTAWPWRIFSETEEDEGEIETCNHYVWVRSDPGLEELEALLRAAEEDRARFLVTDSTLRWMYSPYYAGADVILPDTDTRDWLRDRHPDWLSDLRSGL
jgi:hypothetical protein